MIKYLYLILFLFQFSFAYCQKNDFIWEIGITDPSLEDTSRFMGTQLNFHYDPVKVSFDWQFRTMPVIGSNAIYNDFEGNYRCMTNRTWISNKFHNPMQNGDPIFQDVLGQNSKDLGTNQPQGVLFLPWPDKPDSVLLVTQKYFEGYGESLWYTTIDIEEDSGKGAVVSEEVEIAPNKYRLGYLTATQHANGRDWWLLLPGTNPNKMFSFLFSPSGIELIHELDIGLSILANESNGQAKFCPDGSKYSILESEFNSAFALVHLFEFDRCNGMLSDKKTDTIPSDRTELGHGLSFSYNGSKLYANTAFNIFQYDLKDNDLDSKIFIDAFDGFQQDYPNGIKVDVLFGYTTLGPDGMIYMCTASSVPYLHRIRYPEKTGIDCGFFQRDLKIKINFQSIPNFVNYRLGSLEGSTCDTLGVKNSPIARFLANQRVDELLGFKNLSFHNPTSHLWSLNSNTFSTSIDPEIISIDTTIDNIVCLIVSNDYGTDTLCKTIEAIKPTGTNGYSLSDIQIFPNPSEGFVFINLNHERVPIGHIKIFDVDGKQISSNLLKKQVTKIDLSYSNAGIYFIIIFNESGNIIYYDKIIKI